MTLVTGFLGAGKTTLIRQLLDLSPVNERWAVLVNEFGDIGLDSAFYSNSDVAIKEVPGGCVCCTTSAAFQQGLNQLIKEHNPDRIFIEPSGLGHPKQIIQKLRGTSYHDVLLLTGAFCVLDARNLKDERYTKHTIFNDQIESANGIVFSHVDSYQKEDIEMLEARFSAASLPDPKPATFLSNPMHLDLEDLDIGLINIPVEGDLIHTHDTGGLHDTSHSHHAGHSEKEGPVQGSTHQEDAVQIETSPWHYQKHQDGMKVLGWRWPIDENFNQDKVKSMVHDVAKLNNIYRVKGVFSISITEALFVNLSRGEVTFNVSPWDKTSRMEVIGAFTKLDEENAGKEDENSWPYKTLSLVNALI
ncbi:CobW family GTP-binding protein [Marinomonas colpomeniae]|uniref:GTP-binding protein n=1 Tax=Marinomonas colpomeniae TaxID=2774408 RepID=A0ABR8P0V0_9GAMM|nr:GTP-binding protein [Marinomonas colpomeniae]MBD5771505.1 GTP-binding protein [Marinomonas colpomeniae]